jgi:cell cycle checkpoint control protein RAD9A
MPSRPLQLSYEGDGLKCEFLLMTVGERGAPGQKQKKTRASANAKAPRQQELEATASRATSRAASRAASHAPTPALQPTPARQDAPMPSLRPSATLASQRPPPPAFDDDSLFVPMDNDNQWEPVKLNEDEDEENARLEWDASAPPVSPSMILSTLGRNQSADQIQNPSAMNMRSMMSRQPDSNGPVAEESDQSQAQSYLEPTQRLSGVRKFGLFGD